MKYTVYFDEKHLREDGDLINVCDSVATIQQALGAAQEDMLERELTEDCLYMYKIFEEDYDNIGEDNLPDSQEVYWEDVLPPASL